MPPFQQWFIELVSIISNFLVGAAAIAAIIGLWKWRAELVGKTKFEVARKMTLLAFQLRDEIQRARSPFTFAREAAEREKRENEPQHESQILDEYYVRLSRLRPSQNVVRQLQEASWQAEIILSKADSELIKPLEDVYSELRIAIDHHFDELLIHARSSSYIDLSPDQRARLRP